MTNDKYVLFKQFGKFRVTTKENFKAHVRDERKILSLSDYKLKNTEQALNLLTTTFEIPRDNIIVDKSCKQLIERFLLKNNYIIKKLIEKIKS